MDAQLNINAIAAALDITPDGVRERYDLDHGLLSLQRVVRIMADSGLSWLDVLTVIDA